MTDVEPLVGTTLADRFLIKSLIGQGGMASVFRAQDLVLGREVAIKVFKEDTESDRARLAAEVRLLSGLNHPNLVTVHDASLTGDGDKNPSFLVMELIEGSTLRDAIAGNTASGPMVAMIAADVSQALVVVHSAGVVHRDVKPANILIEYGGAANVPVRAKLADFGIAHTLGATRLTQAGTIVGTAAYLSPEQVLGQAVTPASDIYSLGLVLIEALTGRREYAGTLPESLAARLSRDPQLPAALAPGWTALLAAMVDRDAASRPTAATVTETVAQLKSQLDDWRSAPDSSAAATALMTTPTRVLPQGHTSKTRILTTTQAAPRTRRGRVLAVLIVVAGVIIASAVWAAVALGGSTPPTVAPRSTPTTQASVAPSPSSAPSAAPSAAPGAPPATTGHGKKPKPGKGHGKGHK